MKKITTVMKDPYIRNLLLAMSIQCAGTILLARVCTAKGIQAGGDFIINTAERMNPGFTEQLQKFSAAEHYGWKS